MFDHLRQVTAAPRDVMALLRASEEQARLLGAPACEAEHMLLAMLDGPSASASAVLSSLGLTRDRVAEGLEQALVSALALAHVHLAEVPRPRPWPNGGRMRLGESARLVFERSIGEEAEDPGLRLLLAVVHAEGGVIPSLLAEVGVKVSDVETAVTQFDRTLRRL